MLELPFMMAKESIVTATSTTGKRLPKVDKQPRCFCEAFLALPCPSSPLRLNNYLYHIYALHMADRNVPVSIPGLFAYQTLTLSRVPLDGAQSRWTTLDDSARAVDAER